jgi:hypothetical protein
LGGGEAVKSLRQSWLNRKEARAQFQLASQAATPDQPLPSERQEHNYFSSGLIQSRCVSVRTEYEQASVWAVAQTLARSEGRERLLYATPDGPWARLWLLYRAYSDGGAVVLVNTAYMERITDLSRRTLQRVLERGEIPSSEVGYTRFSPQSAVESWRKARDSAAAGASGPGELPLQFHFAEPITSEIETIRHWQ